MKKETAPLKEKETLRKSGFNEAARREATIQETTSRQEGRLEGAKSVTRASSRNQPGAGGGYKKPKTRKKDP